MKGGAVIAVDTNILVYAHRADSPWHKAAKQALTGLAESNRPWSIAWPSVHEFLAVVTNPRIYKPPTPLPAALRQIEAWMESPSLVMLCEGTNYWTTLTDLVIQAKSVGASIHDARIAAICLEHGVEKLWSADRDFSRFVDLKVSNPLH